MKMSHLWHREAKRDEESSKRKAVLERAANKTIQAVRGLREHAGEGPFTCPG